MPAKETVIVVHGTWAGPVDNVDRWYEPTSDGDAQGFVSKLDDALNRRGSSARCWAHCNGKPEIFTWSGANDWVARVRASADLANYVNRLQGDGWRCHLVAHSHGGNVVHDALARIMIPAGGQCGRVVSLGTPFIDATAPIEVRRRRGRLVRKVTDSILALALLAVALFGILFFVISFDPTNTDKALLRGAGSILVGVPVLALAIRAVAGIRRYRRHRRAPAAPMRPHWLAVGSAMDEAWQVLHHLRRFPNPLLSAPGVLSYLVSNWRAQVGRSFEIARVHGAKSLRDLTWPGRIFYLIVLALTALTVVPVIPMIRSGDLGRNPDTLPILIGIIAVFWLAPVSWGILVFGWPFYSALWAPLRWTGRQVLGIVSVPAAVGTYFIRKNAWTLIQAAAMGLDGYRYRLPDVTTKPGNRALDLIEYAAMPEQAEQRALRGRDAWLAAHFGSVSDTFSQMTVTTVDISTLLQKVERDVMLVHAAYYTDDDCIDQIAGWIVGPAGVQSHKPLAAAVKVSVQTQGA